MKEDKVRNGGLKIENHEVKTQRKRCGNGRYFGHKEKEKTWKTKLACFEHYRWLKGA